MARSRLAKIETHARTFLLPPVKLKLSDWLENNIRLPEGITALPGPLRLWPFQREIADAIGDPEIERVTLVKGVRIGFSTLVNGAIGSYVANDPAPIMLLLPTESDCRDAVVSDIDPLFDASPALSGLLSADSTDETSLRNTLLSRRFPGGFLKVVAARSPRNLRRHTVRILFADEIDGMEKTAEGSPLRLAERRTMSFANRKIVFGSTPTLLDASHVLRAYAESDQRIYECPCPKCDAFTDIKWANIEWEEGKPETAAFRCPHCRELISERLKPQMVAMGRWRVTKPEVKGHAGFKLNALVSLIAMANWSRLATEFIAAKEDPEELQTFINTILAEGWSEAGAELDETALQGRAETFGLENIPIEVLVVTAGVDVQDDRLECTITGWSREGVCFVLGHIVIWGSVEDDTTWIELDELLCSRWKHPLGGVIGVDACAVDSGDNTDKVYSFCFPRLRRRVMAIKGMAGPRPSIKVSVGKIKGGGRLWLVGVDTLKATVFNKLSRGIGIRFSNSLEATYYDQLASEKRVVRYSRGQPHRRFERIGGKRAEALDALIYATAARAAVPVQLDAREALLSNKKRPRTSLAGKIAGWKQREE
jgi:phage terminase large subunit GpA-like protein